MAKWFQCRCELYNLRHRAWGACAAAAIPDTPFCKSCIDRHPEELPEFVRIRKLSTKEGDGKEVPAPNND